MRIKFNFEIDIRYQRARDSIPTSFGNSLGALKIFSPKFCRAGLIVGGFYDNPLGSTGTDASSLEQNSRQIYSKLQETTIAPSCPDGYS
jgi:hypothetical protein